jgi:hypothetical protein
MNAGQIGGFFRPMKPEGMAPLADSNDFNDNWTLSREVTENQPERDDHTDDDTFLDGKKG